MWEFCCRDLAPGLLHRHTPCDNQNICKILKIAPQHKAHSLMTRGRSGNKTRPSSAYPTSDVTSTQLDQRVVVLAVLNDSFVSHSGPSHTDLHGTNITYLKKKKKI